MFAERLYGVLGAGRGVAAAGGRQGGDAATVEVNGQQQHASQEAADHDVFC